ncbi:unnamed protein product [marine sediment metagenome]|uniref:Uncharacterized protein n=1 Tax=marine sediment metagenome TaxID=412755 RepID=X1JVF1_9ZZZZ
MGNKEGGVSKMIEIILARHGETEWNVAEVFRGRIEVFYLLGGGGLIWI